VRQTGCNSLYILAEKLNVDHGEMREVKDKDEIVPRAGI
jgi:hypothetical protein